MHLRVEPACIVDMATSLVMGDPHSGQKFRRTGWPLSPVSLNVLSPQPTTTVKAVPACFWQFLQ
jgi:hypothetical protein